MRRAARIDANHNSIVETLRRFGATVQSIASIGKGCPDLIVGYRGINYLVEIKDGAKCDSQQKLTPDEKIWHSKWDGQVVVINSNVDALKMIKSR